MIGMEFRFDVWNIILESLKQGILVLDAGRNVLRFSTTTSYNTSAD